MHKWMRLKSILSLIRIFDPILPLTHLRECSNGCAVNWRQVSWTMRLCDLLILSFDRTLRNLPWDLVTIDTENESLEKFISFVRKSSRIFNIFRRFRLNSGPASKEEREKIISLKHVSCHLNLFKKNRSLALLTFHLETRTEKEMKKEKYSSYLWECQKNANEKRNPIHFRRRRRQTKRRRWLLKDSCSLKLLFYFISLLLFAAWWPQIKRTIE